MELIWDGLVKAIIELVTLDPGITEVALLTLQVSGAATLISVLIGIPLGSVLALSQFPGRNFLVSISNFGMGLPPVVVGLWVSIFLWRSGPLGFLNIIYTPYAMIIAQAVIASPIVISFTLAVIQQINPQLRLQLTALGANRTQMVWTLLKETKLGLLAAVMAGFGGVISEVGASMMVGGNIKGMTRVFTTATVMEVSKGNFDIAIALSILLMLLAYSVTAILTAIQQGRNIR
ncbi:MAG: ABC-type tungstate transport system, periplasmic component [Desulfotomaculum sp. 46_296]|nr:MAG: ABC-type tungstate transport system, periplasmic component [Desulfotomaculum sp. 46_296]HAU31991.1 tungstate transporter permease [Desulfotomaculum sp.]